MKKLKRINDHYHSRKSLISGSPKPIRPLGACHCHPPVVVVICVRHDDRLICRRLSILILTTILTVIEILILSAPDLKSKFTI